MTARHTMPPGPALPDRPFAGILLMLGFCVLAPMADALAKLLGDLVPLGPLVLVRFAVQAVLLLPLVILGAGGWQRMRVGGRLLGLIGLRTVLHIIGIGAMFSALRFLPLADALAIVFVMPFIMLLLGRFVLGEEVGPHRLAACALGFGGTLLVIQPNFAAVGAPALLPLGVAVAFALFMMVTRQVARSIDPVALQCLSGLQATALLVPALLFMPLPESIALRAPPVMPDAVVLAMLAGLGVLGTGGHLLVTWSLRFAPASTLAPMQYLEIPVATLIGWLVFRDLPDGLAAVGIAITVAAGLYVIARERAMSRRPARPPPVPAPAIPPVP